MSFPCVHTWKDIQNGDDINMTRRGLTPERISIRKDLHAEGYTYGRDISVNMAQSRHKDTHEETCVSLPCHVVCPAMCIVVEQRLDPGSGPVGRMHRQRPG